MAVLKAETALVLDEATIVSITCAELALVRPRPIPWIWLAAQNDSLSAARQWNREFPKQPIHIAWKDSEWRKLDDWTMPTFYIFRHGKLVDK